MSPEFSQYIKLIGKGKRAGKYLSVEQANTAMSMVLSEKVSAEQLGAFLMLLRVREESAEELAGFTLACRQFNDPQLAKSLDSELDLGCYAGKRRHLPWLVLAVMVMAQKGHRIFLHGTQEPESNRLYLSQVFEQLNLPIAQNALQAKTLMDKYGFVYMDLADINQPLHKLIQLRSHFGLRSPANTIARMLNPSHSKYALHGVFHKHFDSRHVETAALMGDDKVACFRGEGGEIEVNPERPFDLHLRHNEENQQLSFPALLSHWQIKPREMDIPQLKSVWTGSEQSDYGVAAIVGTIATMLILTEQCEVPHAMAKATGMWEKRVTNWPAV